LKANNTKIGRPKLTLQFAVPQSINIQDPTPIRLAADIIRDPVTPAVDFIRERAHSLSRTLFYSVRTATTVSSDLVKKCKFSQYLFPLDHISDFYLFYFNSCSAVQTLAVEEPPRVETEQVFTPTPPFEARSGSFSKSKNIGLFL
jgi:hypothetical protein